MFFDTREPAPISVRWARVIVPLLMCFAYTVFRVYPAVDQRIPLAELLSAGAVFAGLVLVAFLALGDLIVPRLPIEAPHAEEPSDAAPEDAFDWGRVEGDLLATEAGNWPGRADVKRELLSRAYGHEPAEAVTEELLTHEYHAMHHTPARGITLVRPDLLPPEIFIPTTRPTIDAFGQRTGGGRHRKAGA